MRVLVAGARGFIGRALCPALENVGHQVRPGMRPSFDVDDEDSVRRALHGMEAAVWLVHGLRRAPGVRARFLHTGRANGFDYAEWETRTARRFAERARDAGVQRLVYLGGIDPAPRAHGQSSRHLSARLATGDALRSAGLPVVELRAAMVIGAGSESWLLARDGAARLPAFLEPPWLAGRTQPVALDDVVAALVASVGPRVWPRSDGRSDVRGDGRGDNSTSVEVIPPGIHDVPGPEVMTGREVVQRTAALLGRRTTFHPVPQFPRTVAALLAPYVTRADRAVALELFRSVGFDLVVEGDGVFQYMPSHRRVSFDEAVKRAIADDRIPLAARLYEEALRRWRPL